MDVRRLDAHQGRSRAHLRHSRRPRRLGLRRLLRRDLHLPTRLRRRSPQQVVQQARPGVGLDFQRPVLAGAEDERQMVERHVLEVLEGVRSAVAGAHPEFTRRSRPDVGGGFDPQAALAVGVGAFGGGAFAFGDAAAQVQDLIDESVDLAGARIDGEGVVALVALAAAVADGAEGEGILAGEVQFGGVLGQDDDGGPVGAEVLQDDAGVGSQDDGVGEFGGVGKAKDGAVVLGGGELVR